MTLGANSPGEYQVSIEHNMRVYDRLPAALRNVLRNALFSYACPPIEEWLAAGGAIEDAVDRIIGSDIKLTRKHVMKDWGDQADAYRTAQKSRKRRDWYDAPPRGRHRL